METRRTTIKIVKRFKPLWSIIKGRRTIVTRYIFLNETGFAGVDVKNRFSAGSENTSKNGEIKERNVLQKPL